MKALPKYNEISQEPLSSFFIAGVKYDDIGRIEFGAGWNDSRAVGTFRHNIEQFDSILKEFNPILYAYPHQTYVSVHSFINRNLLTRDIIESSVSQTIIIMGADTLDLQGLKVIYFGPYSEMDQTLTLKGYIVDMGERNETITGF